MLTVLQLLFAVVVVSVNAEELLPTPVKASQTSQTQSLPTIRLNIENGDGEVETISVGVQVLLLMTVLSLAPAILIMCTSFTRIIIILSFVRQALGIQQTPSNQILISLTLFLTFFIMSPVWNVVNETALKPFQAKSIGYKEAINKAAVPVKKFMLAQSREKDLALFVDMSKIELPENPIDLPFSLITPAFIISELKTAFQVGFMIYIPFLVLDMIVSSILMSMGMMMLPPIIISLPFKLMLFVISDGWHLLVGSLLTSFN